MPLDPHAQRLVRMAGALGGRRSAGSPAERRATLSALASAADHMSPKIEAQDLELDGPGGPLRIVLYSDVQDDRRLAPVLIFFHGGGWVAGGPESHGGLCGRLCIASGCRVALVDYRLAPEHPFPAALEDGWAALEWIALHGASVGLDANWLAIGGDSVGAGLAAAIAQRSCAGSGPAIRAQVLICPILDPARAGRALAGRDVAFLSAEAIERDIDDYLGPGRWAIADPRVAPLRSMDLSGLPPALVEVAECDPLSGDGEAFAAALSAAGSPVRLRRHAGMIHYFYALARAIPYAEEAAEAIGADLAAMLQPESRRLSAA